MKKTAFLAILVIVSLMLSSCGGMINSSHILAMDRYGENISIKINVRRPGGVSGICTRFVISEDINGLSELIAKKNPSLSTAVYQNRFILITMDSSFGMIKPIEKLEEDKENENRYVFFVPVGTFGGYGNLDVPCHLIKDEIWIDALHSPQEDRPPVKTEYEVTGTIEEFYDFYKKLNYDVTIEDNVLVFKGRIKTRVTFFQSDGVSKVTFPIW